MEHATHYDQVLGVIDKAFGKRALGALGISDFRRWYDEAKKPKRPGEPERVRKAHGIITMLRRLLGYASWRNWRKCAASSRSSTKPASSSLASARETGVAHVQALIAKGHRGRAVCRWRSARPCSFETTLRQRDVIGEWEPIRAGQPASGITLGARRWCRGLIWSGHLRHMTVVKETTKTGARRRHDLTLCPLVMDVLAMIRPRDGWDRSSSMKRRAPLCGTCLCARVAHHRPCGGHSGQGVEHGCASRRHLRSR